MQRQAVPTAVFDESIYLLKRASSLRLTYQVRLLAHRAWQEGKKLRIDVPANCEVHDSLARFAEAYPGVVEITRG